MAVNKRLLQGPTGGGALTPSENFKVVLYTGNGGTQSITGVGFKPDFVWIKERSAAESHRLFDSTRGATKRLFSDNTNAQSTATDSLTSFDTDGFSLGSSAGINESGQTYVAWCWKAKGGTTSSNTDGTITSTVQANKAAGFSIVTYTGTGSAASAGHGLSGSPDLVIIKNREATTNWQTWYTGAGTVPASGINRLYLNTTDANDNSTTNVYYPDATKINFNSGDHFFNNTDDFVAYCFKSIDGFSKIGSYEGNGTTTGPMVETGFEPAFILIKDVDGSDNWALVDNKRATTNPRQTWLRPNLSNAEFTNTVDSINFYSNGFQVAGGTSVSNFLNENGNTFIYMAFAADPDTEAPTLADSFGVQTYTGNGSSQSITGLGFKPNLVWLKSRSSTYWNSLVDSVRGAAKPIFSNSTSAETTDNIVGEFLSDGFTTGTDATGSNNGSTYVAWAWKADDNEATIEEVTEDVDAIAIYKFEDNANDVTGNYNGTASNVTYSSSGKFNKAAEFNGSSSFINTGISNTTIPLSSNFSISAWINTNSSSGFFIAEGNFNSWSTAGFGLGLAGSNVVELSFGNNTSGGAQVQSSALAANTWHHIVGVVEIGNVLTLYVNGVSVGTNALTTSNRTSVSGGFNIGADAGGYDYTGKLDQVRFYNKALTAASVTNLYNETTAQNDTLNIGTKAIVSIQSIVSANANAGFSIVKYTGNGITGTKVPHGLSAAPEMIIVKNLEAGENWAVYHSATGVSNVLFLNESNATTSVTNKWAGTNSTVFGVNSAGDVNQSGVQLIAYCFHSVSSYSKISSYSGGSTGSGNVITTGFQPDWIMIKRTDIADDWTIIDSVRGDGASSKRLIANTNEAEKAATSIWFPTSTGFYFSGTGASYNSSGGTYIYMAIKINPSPIVPAGQIAYLVVAGGGGGGGNRLNGNQNGGGGGAGGLRTSFGLTSGGGSSSESNITLSAQTYTITVGAGGAAGVSDTGRAGNGADSVFSTITSIGGGSGGSQLTDAVPRAGGSGGGGSTNGAGGSTGGAGTTNQGFAGATCAGYGASGGGGGGASAVGQGLNVGTGGAGLEVSITGAAVAYAGGGGGSVSNGGGAAGAGGVGGGGNGAASNGQSGGSGITNTGGGGGGAYGGSSNGGPGGSGVVILRLRTTDYSGTTTGSPTVTTVGDETILKYTGSGTYVHS